MAAASGNSFLLAVGDEASPQTFTTVAGLNTTGLTINNALVDTTTKDSAHKRELLSAGGVQSMSISATGVFTDAASEETVRANANANTLNTYRLTFPNGDTYAGSFLISSYERSGDNDAAEQYSLTLESSGTIIFT